MLCLLSLGCLLFFVGMSFLNVLTAPRLRRGNEWLSCGRQSDSRELPLVSVLVPARNEAHQIAACVTSLMASDYPRFEVIVADDQSTDGTGDVLCQLVALYGAKLSIRTLEQPPPPGWTGKARTCHELASHAAGEILIFCDADVEVSPYAVGGTVGYFLYANTGALTALPRQIGGSPLVQAVVAVVTQMVILVTLPLDLVSKTRMVALATGNGQWFAWKRSVYESLGGHAVVKASRIEDVAMARLVKKAAAKLTVALAATDLDVKMYQDWESARLGFRKNLFALVGDSLFGVLVASWIVVISVAAPFLAWREWGGLGGMSVAFLAALPFGAQAVAFRTDRDALLRLPLGMILTVGLLWESAYFTRKGRLNWKDRHLPSIS